MTEGIVILAAIGLVPVLVLVLAVAEYLGWAEITRQQRGKR